MRTYKAFVSSTYIDLKDHRLYVIDALRKAGFHVDPMEDWTADSDEPKAFSQERVDDCDLCILLVAFRRGHVPDGETKSITQMEYEHAVTNGIDVLPFLLEEKAPWSRDFDELDKDPSLRDWRAELREHYGVGFFVLARETVQIAPALTRWLHKQKEAEEPAISYWLARPPSLGDSFVGRTDDMDSLVRGFSEHRAVVVSGGAGTGKSRLAAEYAHQCGLDGFWSDAGGTVAQTLAALAPALDVEVEGRSDEEIAAQVQRRLATLSADTLWVVDNLGDLNLVNELLGTVGAIRLLITTRDGRRQLLPGTVAFQIVETLEPVPAGALLCSRSDCDPKHPALPEIAEAVGRLPLALEMLAVRLGEPLQTPEKLLAELREAPTAIELQAFEEAAGATIATEGVVKTITGTLASLAKRTRQRLSPLGYLADAPIPEPLLAALTGLEEEGLSKFLAQCSRQSVLRARGGDVVVHALTAAAIATTNDEAALSRTVAHAWHRIDAIHTDDPVALRVELAHHERLLLHAKARISGEDGSVLYLANSLANAYQALGRYEEAVRLGEETLAARERLLGADHPDTLTSRSNLAADYRATGRMEEAIRLAERTLEARERILGPNHRRTTRSRNNLANAYRDAGRTEEAIHLHEETLAALERALGADHADTLVSRSNLAIAYATAGRTEEAIPLWEQTLAARELVLGPDHPDTLASRKNLVVGYRRGGRMDDAIRLGEETLAAQERVLGPDHPESLGSRGNLANAYRDAARTEEAILLDEETLAARERVLGPDHPDTLSSCNNLAASYWSAERTADGIGLFEQALARREQVLGPTHPDTEETRGNLVEVYRAVGRDEDADQLERKAPGKSKPKRKRRGRRQG